MLTLVIEDEVSIRRFLRAALEAQGFPLIEAGTGSQGLFLAAARQPDTILLDLGLPDMDGLEVLKRLREVWGPNAEGESDYVHQLRRKLEADPVRPRYLQTEPGVGYRLLGGE